jgi:hypothetical protein
MSSTVNQFQTSYQQFQNARNAVFGEAAKEDVSKSSDENNAQFLLRLARWAAAHWRDNTAAWQSIDKARGLGRSALQAAASAWAEEDVHDYMMQQGYCEAANVYLFTAPLDAINATYMSGDYAPFADKTGESWLHVATMNQAIKDAPNTNFLKQYAKVRAETSDGDDPYPSGDMAAVLADIRGMAATVVPAEFEASAKSVKSLFGFN